MESILIVEDDKNIQRLIKDILTIVKYETSSAMDGEEALAIIEKERFNLILLDIMLPKLDGFEIMEKISNKNIPVIFLTARNDVDSIVKGFNLGIQDYIRKPFEPLELLARVEATLRRTNNEKDIYKYNDIVVNILERKVTKDSVTIFLTPKEFDLFLLLVKNVNIALSRDKILNCVWGYDIIDIETRTVDYHIQQLRKKLDLKDSIVSVNKIGYRLES